MVNAWCRRLGRLWLLAPVILVPNALAQSQGGNGANATSAPTVTELQSISVIGKGETRRVQAVTREDQEQEAPGTSPIKTVAKLPGVNYQSVDAYGAYEWALRISIRGFAQNQLGFTLDEVPLGDMSYANYNGLHISRAITSENIGRTVLSQGAGSLDTASSSNLGGTLQFYSIDPSGKPGIDAEQVLGSDDILRSYLRLETGRLSSGTRAYVSYVDQSQHKWKGAGTQKYGQLNLKVVQELGGRSRISLLVDVDNRKEVDYQDLTKQYLGVLGYNWDNFFPNWGDAIQTANAYAHTDPKTGEQDPNYPYPLELQNSGFDDKVDAAYYAGSGLRRDLLIGSTLNLRLPFDLVFKATPYVHRDDGKGTWFTPYSPSPGYDPGTPGCVGACTDIQGNPVQATASDNAPISERTTEYGIARYGLVSSLTWLLDSHKPNVGVWYEHSGFNQARRFYALGYLTPGLSPYDYANDPFRTQWQYQFDTTTVQFHLQDDWQILDNLKANIGFKASDVSTTATIQQTDTRDPGDLDDLPSGMIEAQRWFLPQAGVVWTLNPRDEVFASIAKNMRAYPVSHTADSPFATTRAGFNYISGSLQPETSWTSELGYRLDMNSLEGEVSVYHVDFSNRLLAAPVGPSIQGNPNVLANVGGVVTNGGELSLLWRFLHHASWYNAVSYNKSTYQENVNYSNGDTANTAGKPVVDTPRLMYKTELSWEHNGFFTNLSGNYMTTRSYTYEDDNNVPPQFVADFGIGYRIRSVGYLRGLTVQFNITNLFDRKYISTLGTNGFGDSDPNGTSLQTLQVGAPRQLFMTVSGQI